MNIKEMNEMSNYGISIRDPLYGFINISKKEELLINTPTFQRLNRITQLSSTYLVYPSASHTRLEHSLGAFKIAYQKVESLNLKTLIQDFSFSTYFGSIYPKLAFIL